MTIQYIKDEEGKDQYVVIPYSDYFRMRLALLEYDDEDESEWEDIPYESDIYDDVMLPGEVCDVMHKENVSLQAAWRILRGMSQQEVAEKLGISAAKVYSVATFYENFSLEAKGKHIIKVCAGTACHVRKSQPIFDAVHDYLGLSGKKKTSADGMFTLETVACLGACGLAPVMTIDGEVHSKMTPEAALSLLEEIREKEASVHAAD